MKRLWLLLLPFILVSSVWAEEKVKLEEVVVTATRTEEETDKIPANVTVITQEDIRKSPATTVPDLLRDEEGLIVRDFYGTGTKSTVDMRGFTHGLDTAILIDGKKVNEIDISGVDWNLIPLENVERIEIVRGSGSVLYGDNALAGVINIITKKGSTLKPQLDLDTQAESYNGNKETFSIGGAANIFNYFLLLKHSETNGYRENSAFNANDAATSFTVNPVKNLFIDLRAGYHWDNQRYPGGLSKNDTEQNRRQSTQDDEGVRYKQYYYGIDFVYSPEWGEIQAGYKFNSRDFTDTMAGDLFGGSYTSNDKRDTDTNKLNLKLTLRKNIFDYRNVLVSGIDYSSSDVDDNNVFDFFGVSTTVSNVKKQETGIYIEDEFFLNDKWSFTAGYRYTLAKFEDNIKSNSTFGTTSGSGTQKFYESAVKAGLAYNYAEGAKVFVSYSRGFRLPATDELFAYDGTVAFLKPEKSDDYEIGIVHPFSKYIQTRLTAFYMNIRDEIFLDPSIGFLGKNVNLDKTKHYGGEFGVSVKPVDFVSLFGNFTYTEAQFESGAFKGNTIPLIPRYSANAGGDIRLKDAVTLSLKVNWVGDRLIENDVENNKVKLPDYITFDSKLSYKYKMVTAYVGVNNIFNKKYSEYGAFGWSSGNIKFYPAPERNYFGGVRISF